MAIIEKPISLINVANTLGYYEYKPHPVTGANSRTVDLGRLCTHPNINKWSKYKPVRFNSVVGLTEANFKSVNYGLTPPSPTTNYESIVNTKWVYDKPLGGSSQPFRVGDFRNYFHDADAPVIIPSEITINRTIQTQKEFGIAVSIAGADTILGLADFSEMYADYYFGIIFEKDGNKWIQTANDTILNGGSSFIVGLDQQPFNNSTSVNCYHLLCNKKVSTLQTLTSQGTILYLPLPNKDFEEAIIQATISSAPAVSISITHVGIAAERRMLPIGPYMGIDAIPFNTMGNLYFKLQLTNNNNTAVMFGGGTFTMRVNPTYFGANLNTFGANLSNNEGSPISSILVPPNSSVNVNIGADNIVNRDGTYIGTPTLGTEILSTINIYQNNTSISAMALKLRAE